MLFATAEVRRSKVRFGMLTFGAGLLVFVLLFQQALLDSLLEGMTGAITSQSAPVLVLAAEAQGSVGGSVLTAQQVEDVAAAPAVDDAAELAVTLLSFRAPDDDQWHNASVIGYQMGRPGSPTGLKEGRLPEAPEEVVASAEDAPGRYGIGDTVVMEPGGVPLVVVGLTEGSRMNVSPTIWVPWETYGELVELAVPDATEVFASVAAVQPQQGAETVNLVDALNVAVPELEAMTREEAAERVPGKDAIQMGFWLVMGLSYLVVALVIGFFFLTMTLQKQQSVTMLRAIGARGSYLVRCLLVQVALVSAGGLLIGAALLFVAAETLRATLVVSADPGGMVWAAGPALAVALLGAIPSARRILRADASRVFAGPTMGGIG